LFNAPGGFGKQTPASLGDGARNAKTGSEKGWLGEQHGFSKPPLGQNHTVGVSKPKKRPKANPNKYTVPSERFKTNRSGVQQFWAVEQIAKTVGQVTYRTQRLTCPADHERAIAMSPPLPLLRPARSATANVRAHRSRPRPTVGEHPWKPPPASRPLTHLFWKALEMAPSQVRPLPPFPPPEIGSALNGGRWTPALPEGFPGTSGPCNRRAGRRKYALYARTHRRPASTV